jgi:hypothetical protein
MGSIRSLLVTAGVVCAACSGPGPVPGQGPSCQVLASSGAWQVSPKVGDYTVAVRAAARVFAIQGERELFATEVSADVTFPHPVTIPIGRLRDGVSLPVYVVVVPPPWSDDPRQPIWRDPMEKCRICQECCVPPPVICP